MNRDRPYERAELLRNKTAGIIFLSCSINFFGRITTNHLICVKPLVQDGTAVAIVQRLESIHLTFWLTKVGRQSEAGIIIISAHARAIEAPSL